MSLFFMYFLNILTTVSAEVLCGVFSANSEL
jgi:hypothetical protein